MAAFLGPPPLSEPRDGLPLGEDLRLKCPLGVLIASDRIIPILD